MTKTFSEMKLVCKVPKSLMVLSMLKVPNDSIICFMFE